MRGRMYLLWILIILPHICASQYLHGGTTNGVDMATSPLEPVPDTMHPRFVMVHTDVHVLLLNSSASQKFPNAVSNILAVADSVQSNAKVRSALYCSFTYTVLDVDQSNVEKPSPAYISSEDIIQEIVSTVPTQFAELPIMDPINTTTSTRQMDPAVVYLFPTLGQQFFVLSDYMTHKSSSKVIYPVFREDGVLNHAALLESLTLSMQYFDLTPGPLSTFTSTVVAALHSNGVNVVVGLTQADLVPLVLFLDTHPLAKVMVIFDEFTLLYDELLDAFGKSHRASMDRLLYATNLPRWTIPPTDPRAVVLSLFFRTFDKSLWTPAALRTFLTTFVMDTLSHGVGHIYKKNLVEAVYSGHPISIDSSISFGPFRSSCYAPSLYPAFCLVNYGARDIRLWSLSSAFDSSVSSLYGPVLVHMTLDGKGGLEMALWADPLDVFLVVVYAVVFLHLIAFGILIYLGFRTSVLDADDEVATVLYVRILHRGNSKSDQSEICRHFEDLLDKMLDTYNFERLESTDDSCVLVAHSASTAIQFAQTLHDEFFLHDECRDMATGAELSIGLHSGLCAAARAVEAQDGMMLASAIAPIVLLASCVSRLCTESVTLVTRWTLEAVRLEKVLLPFEPHLVGKYRLDDEDTLISVYRMRALPMKDANGSPCSSFECSSQKMADNPLTAVASFEARDSV